VIGDEETEPILARDKQAVTLLPTTTPRAGPAVFFVSPLRAPRCLSGQIGPAVPAATPAHSDNVDGFRYEAEQESFGNRSIRPPRRKPGSIVPPHELVTVGKVLHRLRS
jgi:hypothetical protein